MNSTLGIYSKFERYPLGKRLFSMLVCLKAPYFSTVRPLFKELEAGKCVIFLKKRRAVTNHLKTVHAIAMCNIVELAAGMCVDVTLPSDRRWVPRGMTVEYVTFAKTDLTGVCIIDPVQLTSWDMARLFPVQVNLRDKSGVTVMKGVVNMYFSLKK